MFNVKLLKLLVSAFIGAGILIGCGGGSSGGTTVPETTTGTIVDPYIVGATMCEDEDQSGTCDSGEQLSTPSTALGQFTFSSPLRAGSHIIVATHGLHNGIPYDLNISGVVDSGGEIEVVSPITTLETKGLTKAQIISLLDSNGSLGLSEADISSDPMGGLSGKTSVTNSELKKLQASLATYGLLKIIESSDEIKVMTPSQLVSSTAVQQITTAMVTAVRNNLNQTTFNTIKTTMDGVRTTANGINPLAGSYIPDVTTDVIIKTAVTAMNRIVEAGYNKSKETDGNITLAIAEANSVATTVVSQIDTIAKYYYGLENKTKLSTIPLAFQSLIPTEIQTGVNNTAGIFVLNADNQIATKQTTKLKNLWSYVELNGGDLGDSTITANRLASDVSSLKITNEANQTITYNFPSTTIDINVSSISNGKNKLSVILSNGDENYLYFYKGLYDANDDNQSLKGDTNYYFNNIKAGGVVANDMFVMVQNFNDSTRSDDDRWIYMLPYDNNNSIAVKNLKSTGGYRVTSINYEQYIVANTNADNAGQDITTSSSLDVRKFVVGKSIAGTLKKIVNNAEVPFTLSDLGTESIWLHAHYIHPTATYTATCKSGSSVCNENSSGNVWIGAQDVHLSSGEYQNSSGNYNVTTGVYSINNLANDIGYKLLAFWREKSILGWEYDINSSTNNNIILGGETKDINGTLANPFTHIKIARKTMFSGQPYYSYSTVTKKDINNIFTINYHFDTVGTTTSYLIYGDVNSTLDFSSTCDIGGNGRCISIQIGGVDDNSTNVTIP
jgi:hypothetical protein